jgi:hypothetical protein
MALVLVLAFASRSWLALPTYAPVLARVVLGHLALKTEE